MTDDAGITQSQHVHQVLLNAGTKRVVRQ